MDVRPNDTSGTKFGVFDRERSHRGKRDELESIQVGDETFRLGGRLGRTSAVTPLGVGSLRDPAHTSSSKVRHRVHV